MSKEQAKRTTLKDIRKLDPEKMRHVQTIMQKVNRAAKASVVAFADDVPNHYMLRRPSGIMDLDIDLGGGLPSGGLTVYAGLPGAGKSVMMYKNMAMQQRIKGDACMLALAPIEYPIDHFFLRECGVMVAIPDEIIEQKQDELQRLGLPLLTKDQIKEYKRKVGQFVIIQEDTLERTLDVILDFYGADAFDIIGVDSFSIAQTEAEAKTDSLGDPVRQASSATALTNFTHKFAPLTKKSKTALVGTCQVRANRERANAPSHMQKYIKPYVPSIPYALYHSMLIGVMFWPGEKVREKQKAEGDEKAKSVQTGKILNWEVIKGKIGVHEGIRGEAEYDYEDNVDNATSIVRCAMRANILVEKGGIFTFHRHGEGREVLLKDIPGVEALKERLNEDLEFEMRMRAEVLAAAGKSCVYW